MYICIFIHIHIHAHLICLHVYYFQRLEGKRGAEQITYQALYVLR